MTAAAALERELVAAFRARRPPAFPIAATHEWVKAIDDQIEKGRHDLARHAVRCLREAEPDLEWARNVHHLLQRTARRTARSSFRDDRTKDVQTIMHDHSESLILCFCGAAHRLSMPLSVFHQWLAPLSSHVVYLRDFKKAAYLGGIASLGADLASSIRALQAMAAKLGARRIFCIGNSVGGYAALHYGLALGAQGVLSLAGLTNMEPVFNEHLGRVSIARQLRASFPKIPLDCKPLFLAAKKPPRVLIIYGENAWDDRLQAEHMAEIPGVELMPIANHDKHEVTAPLIDSGRFAKILAALVGQGAPPRVPG